LLTKAKPNQLTCPYEFQLMSIFAASSSSADRMMARVPLVPETVTEAQRAAAVAQSVASPRASMRPKTTSPTPGKALAGTDRVSEL
jgi:hypothetical protein